MFALSLLMYVPIGWTTPDPSFAECGLSCVKAQGLKLFPRSCLAPRDSLVMAIILVAVPLGPFGRFSPCPQRFDLNFCHACQTTDSPRVFPFMGCHFLSPIRLPCRNNDVQTHARSTDSPWPGLTHLGFLINTPPAGSLIPHYQLTSHRTLTNSLYSSSHLRRRLR